MQLTVQPLTLNFFSVWASHNAMAFLYAVLEVAHVLATICVMTDTFTVRGIVQPLTLIFFFSVWPSTNAVAFLFAVLEGALVLATICEMIDTFTVQGIVQPLTLIF